MENISRNRLDENIYKSKKFQEITFGDKYWEREIEEWLKKPAGGGGALDDTKNESCNVYIYTDRQKGVVIGIAAVGKSNIKLDPKSKRQSSACVTWIGVQPQHRGEGYGSTILADIEEEAKGFGEDFKLIHLFVHVENKGSISFYIRKGYVSIGDAIEMPKMSSQFYQKMFKKLQD